MTDLTANPITYKATSLPLQQLPACRFACLPILAPPGMRKETKLSLPGPTPSGKFTSHPTVPKDSHSLISTESVISHTESLTETIYTFHWCVPKFWSR